MLTRLAARSFVAVLCLAASSCVINGGGRHGNVTFRWTFGNQVTGCASAPGVSQVLVQIPGQSLANGGVFACTDSGGVDGIQLLDFAPGEYTYTVSGEDSGGTVLFQATGAFTVDGSVTVPVVLMPGTGTPGGLLLTWTFPPTSASGGQPATCAQTPGPVSTVQVSIDSSPAQPVLCGTGQTSPGATFISLAPGTHSIDLAAQDANGFYYYRTISSFTVAPGAYTSQQYSLGPVSGGGLALKWTFSSNATQRTCADAGITQVNVNLRLQGSGTWLLGSGLVVPCVNAGAQGMTFQLDTPGSYEAFFQALGTAGVLYKSAVVPITTPVTSGVFPLLGATSQAVLLTYP